MQFANVERNAHDLQLALTVEEIDRACRAAFGAQARPVDVRLLTSGRFNTVYRIALADGLPVILRVAPPPSARLFRHEARLLQRECAVQPALAALGEVFPKLLHADFSRRVLPRDYVFLNCLGGELWDGLHDQLAPEDVRALWSQFGALVRQIHALGNDTYGYPRVGEGDTLDAPLPPAGGQGECATSVGFTSYAAWFIAHVNGLCADLAESTIQVSDLATFTQLLAEACPLFDAVGPPRLVHGDLWRRNVLVSRSAEGIHITGILDAERAFWGEPGAEWIFSFFDLPEAFWTAYGTDLREAGLDEAARFRRRTYQARGALQLILEARRFGFDDGFAQRNFAQSVGSMRQIVHKT